MIIRLTNGSMVDAQTSARWTITPLPGSDIEDKFGVALLGPPLGQERALHRGTGAECRAFLDALAVELDAVEWCAEKRAFIPVKNNG